VTDQYIYYFTVRDDATGESRLSSGPATLEAIVGQGEAVMESQLVVDHTELDENGFFIAGIDGDSSGAGNISAQIRSIKLRAASRDSQALKMNDLAEGKDKYMLTLERRELRVQARRLEEEHSNRDDRSDSTRNCHA